MKKIIGAKAYRLQSTAFLRIFSASWHLVLDLQNKCDFKSVAELILYSQKHEIVVIFYQFLMGLKYIKEYVTLSPPPHV